MKHQKTRHRSWPRVRKIIVMSALVLAGIFILANGVLWLLYRDRTYPGTRVMGQNLGNTNYRAIAQKVDQKNLLPEKITFTYQKQSVQLSLEEVGISKDSNRTAASARKQKSWLPIVNLFKKPTLQAPISINKDKLANASQRIAEVIRKEPVSARLVLEGTTVTIQKEANGHELDKRSLDAAIFSALDRGSSTASVGVTQLKPQTSASGLDTAKKELEDQLKTPIAFNYSGKTKQASAADTASWMVPANEIYAPSAEKIQAYILATGKEFGIRVKDVPGVATKTEQALRNRQPLTQTLTQQVAVKTFNYCTAVKGVDATHLAGLKTRLQNTYANQRGWSLEGLIEYREVGTGCDFTVWLTAAGLMPSFGEICDSLWSCRVGPNVVINFDRWQSASDSWNASGGSLEDYRHMVINHETGHWLGFGHSNCPGAGQPAPVMQQQSINLQGCVFNPWPTASEQASLRRNLGI